MTVEHDMHLDDAACCGDGAGCKQPPKNDTATAPKPHLAGQTTNEYAIRPLRRDRSYAYWFSSDTCLHLAHSLMAIAVPLFAASYSNDNSLSGGLVACFSAGAIAGLLPGGVLADRYEKRYLVLALCLISFLTSMSMAWRAGQHTGSAAITGVALALLGVSVSAASPAMTATLKRLVHPEQYAYAAGANEGRTATLGLVAPAAAGWLFSYSPASPFIVAAVALLISGATFLFIPTRATGPAYAIRTSAPSDETPVSKMLLGFRLVMRHSILRPLLVAGVSANFAVSLVLILAIFQMKREGISPVAIGSMSSCIAIGSLVGALSAGWLVSRIASGRIIIASLSWVLACMLPLAFVSSSTLVIICLSAAVIVAPSINAVLGTCMVTFVPASAQGRADAAVSFSSSVAAPLAPLMAGFLLQGAGFRFGLTIALLVVTAGLFPSLVSKPLRQLRSPHRTQG